MSQQLQNGKQQFINGSGQPLANGSVGIYTPGTLNPVNTWQDQGLTTLNANPVVLDGSGMASIWGVDGNLYRQIVKDFLGNLVWDEVVGYDPAEYLSLSIAGGVNITLTATQAANRIINLTGAITANINVIVPQSAALWTFQNNTTGAHTVTITTGSGTGISIPQGTADVLACDGINVFAADSSKITLAQADSLYALITNTQSGAYYTATDTGAANAYVMALSPPITAYAPGMMLNIEGIVATNTGASTVSVNGLAALPIVGPAGVALQGGELVATYGAVLRINKAANAAELVYSSGGPNQVAVATKSGHPVNLGQFINSNAGISAPATAAAAGTVGSAGYTRLPDGELHQWAYIQLSDSNHVTWTFPIAFSNVQGYRGINCAGLAGQTGVALDAILNIVSFGTNAQASVILDIQQTGTAGTLVCFLMEAWGSA